jgi:ABC-type Fe3+ transport system substrate-binding protein
MGKSRLIAIGFLVICGLLIAAVSQGWLRSSAPLAIFPTAQPATANPADALTLEVVYSSDKKQWLTEAVARWEQTNPQVGGRAIKVVLRSEGSQSIVTGLEDGSLKPSAIIPASTLQITQINAATIESKQNIAQDAQPLVFTPLVIVAFKDSPADELLADATLWSMLQQKVTLTNRKDKLLFGQTSPVTSNSGLQTLLLMAYAYHNKTRDLTPDDINNPEFVAWLTAYTKNVEKFGDSTGTFMTEMLQFGQSKYSAGAVYESTAIENIQRATSRFAELRIIYPPANVWSDHPFAVLDASWVSAEQRDAAHQLRDFLLSTEQQQAAVKLGFRPSDPDVAIDGADSPFVKYESSGVQRNVPSLVADPSAETIAALLSLWRSLEPGVRK